MRISAHIVVIVVLTSQLGLHPAEAQETKPDLHALILAHSDIDDATKLMTVYDPNEDGVVDKSEQQRLPWKDEVNDFDMNRDGKLTHLEIVVRQAKIRDDQGITQFDINNVSTFLKRYDKNRNQQLEPSEIRRANWPPTPEDYDRNGDGTLTAKELAAQFAFNRGLRREMGIEAVDNVGASAFIRRFDKDGDKKLDADERKAAPLPMLATDFDDDEDGKLNAMELATMLAKHRREVGLSKPDVVKIRKLFQQFDPQMVGAIALKPLEELRRPLGESVGEELGRIYDANQDGIVTIKEVEKVVAEARKERGYAEEEFQEAKKLIARHDKNRSKHIEEIELFDNPESGFLPKSMFETADLNNDGKVGLDELSRYLAKKKKS